MVTESQLKNAIKDVLNSEYLNKIVNFGDGFEFNVKSYNIRIRSRFIPKNEREDYGCDEDANKFFIIEFNDAKKECDTTEAVAICLTLNPSGQVGTSGIPYDYDVEYPMSDFDMDFYDKVMALINKK